MNLKLKKNIIIKIPALEDDGETEVLFCVNSVYQLFLSCKQSYNRRNMGKGLLGKFNLAVEFIYKQSPTFCQKNDNPEKKPFFLIQGCWWRTLKVIWQRSFSRKMQDLIEKGSSSQFNWTCRLIAYIRLCLKGMYETFLLLV